MIEGVLQTMGLPELGALVTVLSAVGGLAFKLGTEIAQTRDRGEEIEANNASLSGVQSQLEEVEESIEGLAGAMHSVEEELERNRADIHYQYQWWHREHLDDDETCNNPECKFCRPSGGAPPEVDVVPSDLGGEVEE